MRAVDVFQTILVHTKGLYRRRPFLLEEWQRDEIIRPLFGSVRWSDEFGLWVRQYRSAWIELARKALAVETPVLTANRGWTTMGDIVVGDQVYSADGTPTLVKWVSPRFDEQIYAVSSASGRELVAGADHDWQVLDRTRPRGALRTSGARLKPTYHQETRSTQSLLAAGLRYGAGAGGEKGFRFALPPLASLQSPAAALSVDPYVLGAWLGDGTSASGAMTAHQDDAAFMRSQFDAAGYVTKATADPQVFYVLKLMTHLRALGVLRNKHIPEHYLLGSIPQRLALLQGLLDTDGCAPAEHAGVTFCNKRRDLVEGVVFLARSLGFKPWRITSRTVQLEGQTCGPYFETGWEVYSDDANPFRMPRKALRVQSGQHNFRETADPIVAIEDRGRGETCCIRVAHYSRTFVAGRDLMVTMNCGKSELLAGIALILLCADGEGAAEVYSAARDKDQAAVVWDVAMWMVKLSPQLDERLRIYPGEHRIVDDVMGSVYTTIAGDALGALGLNPHGVILDEVITQPDSRLWDALRTAAGTRHQPLMILATTAGDDEASFGKAEHEYALRVSKDPELDPTLFTYMRNPDPNADPFDPATWRIANPALGSFKSLEYMQAEARKAANDPLKLKAFKQFELNMWVAAASRAIDMGQWDRCVGSDGPAATSAEMDERARGQRCFAGLDLSTTTDLTSLCLLFPDLGRTALWRFWLPEAMVEELDRLTGGGMRQWIADGWVAVTDGATIDYDEVYAQIDRDRSTFRIVDLNYDRYMAAPVMTELKKRGFADSVQIAQGYAMSAPVKEVLRMVKASDLRHGGNPAARWNAESLEVKQDSEERLRIIKPVRSASGKRIDGMATLVMAVDGAMRRGGKRASRRVAGF